MGGGIPVFKFKTAGKSFPELVKARRRAFKDAIDYDDGKRIVDWHRFTHIDKAIIAKMPADLVKPSSWDVTDWHYAEQGYVRRARTSTYVQV
jgi:hypothetical protein